MKPKTFPELRAEEKQARRRHIALAAEGILHDQGVEAVTIRNVARAVSLSTGSIYMYFKNKEEIFIDLLVERLGELDAKFAAIPPVADPAAALTSMAFHYRDYYLALGRHVDLFRHLATRGGSVPIISTELTSALSAALASVLSTVGRVLSEPVFDKALSGMGPDRAVPVLWSLITGLAAISLNGARAEESGFSFERVLDDTIRLFLMKKDD